MFSKDTKIEGYDEALWAAMQHEVKRQEEHIELIASENYASKRVMQAQGSVLTNKYVLCAISYRPFRLFTPNILIVVTWRVKILGFPCSCCHYCCRYNSVNLFRAFYPCTGEDRSLVTSWYTTTSAR